ncbi:hypothetical protein [Eilatimonas milleporae]|uniref:LTXXQ motif family protein n=1 Tax=Eilatimonas milleporae TaxID=911205 RepID=A0A3M0C5M1_9PROT|nr:hypothetical protein [Eilatimonas milleporae]RMB05028.1 hypothetical protein BXY39_2606 [Eilatimonas milleporae]
MIAIRTFRWIALTVAGTVLSAQAADDMAPLDDLGAVVRDLGAGYQAADSVSEVSSSVNHGECSDAGAGDRYRQRITEYHQRVAELDAQLGQLSPKHLTKESRKLLKRIRLQEAALNTALKTLTGEMHLARKEAAAARRAVHGRLAQLAREREALMNQTVSASTPRTSLLLDIPDLGQFVMDGPATPPKPPRPVAER